MCICYYQRLHWGQDPRASKSCALHQCFLRSGKGAMIIRGSPEGVFAGLARVGASCCCNCDIVPALSGHCDLFQDMKLGEQRRPVGRLHYMNTHMLLWLSLSSLLLVVVVVVVVVVRILFDHRHRCHSSKTRLRTRAIPALDAHEHSDSVKIIMIIKLLLVSLVMIVVMIVVLRIIVMIITIFIVVIMIVILVFVSVPVSEGGMIRLETLIELRFLNSSFSSLSSY